MPMTTSIWREAEERWPAAAYGTGAGRGADGGGDGGSESEGLLASGEPDAYWVSRAGRRVRRSCWFVVPAARPGAFRADPQQRPTRPRCSSLIWRSVSGD